MANTYGEFIFECVNYGHSRESFDVMKECSELDLMEKYISDQQFYQENASVFTEGVTIEAGYFAEAADDSTIQALVEKADAKRSSIISKIYTGLMSALRIVIKFFKKIGNKIEDTSVAAAKIRKTLADINLSPGEDKKIINIIKDAASGMGELAPMSMDKDWTPMEVRVFKSIRIFNKVAASHWLGLALSDKSVYVNVVSTEHDGSIGAIPIEDINDAARMYFLNGGNLRPKYTDSISKLESAWDRSRKFGMCIFMNTKSITKAADNLEELLSKVDKSHQTDLGSPMGAAADGVEMNKYYTMMKHTIGESMKVYTAIESYRRKLIVDLGNWLDNRSKTDNDAGKSSDDAASSGDNKPKDDDANKDADTASNSKTEDSGGSESSK